MKGFDCVWSGFEDGTLSIDWGILLHMLSGESTFLESGQMFVENDESL